MQTKNLLNEEYVNTLTKTEKEEIEFIHQKLQSLDLNTTQAFYFVEMLTVELNRDIKNVKFKLKKKKGLVLFVNPSLAYESHLGYVLLSTILESKHYKRWEKIVEFIGDFKRSGGKFNPLWHSIRIKFTKTETPFVEVILTSYVQQITLSPSFVDSDDFEDNMSVLMRKQNMH